VKRARLGLAVLVVLVAVAPAPALAAKDAKLTQGLLAQALEQGPVLPGRHPRADDRAPAGLRPLIPDGH
jgi:hypothetical protein